MPQGAHLQLCDLPRVSLPGRAPQYLAPALLPHNSACTYALHSSKLTQPQGITSSSSTSPKQYFIINYGFVIPLFCYQSITQIIISIFQICTVYCSDLIINSLRESFASFTPECSHKTLVSCSSRLCILVFSFVEWGIMIALYRPTVKRKGDL